MRVLIAGGGIAGLTTAIALRQRGIDCAVFEAGAADRDQGAGLMLAPNALETLRRLGLYERVAERGYQPRAMGVTRADGRALQETSAEEWKQRYGFAPVAIHRAALHAVLLEALGDVPLRHDAPVKDFADEGARVRLELGDGSRADGDLLVAADGLRSRVRQRLFGPTRFRYASQTSWRGIARHRISGAFSDCLVELWGRGRGVRFGCVPVGDDTTYYFATLHCPAGGSDASFEAARATLRSGFADFPAEVTALIDATEAGQLVRTDIFDFAPLPSWHRGRVVLTGDAAHATTPNLGQGACQAIESAYVLAMTLARDPLEAALLAYEKLRMPKAHFITRSSWRFGQLTNVPGPLGRWLRYSVVPRAPRSSVLKQTDRMFALSF